DVDPSSVAATGRVREAFSGPPHWEVLQGSVLDRSFLARLEPADVVYSWGVLHHTGRMWRALENIGRRVSPRGRLYIALYVTTPSSAYWLEVKRRYNAKTP